jgi:hypothetical protein
MRDENDENADLNILIGSIAFLMVSQVWKHAWHCYFQKGCFVAGVSM